MIAQGSIIVINKNSNDFINLIGYTVEYIGRGSPLGNPFIIEVDGTRNKVIEKYYPYLQYEYLKKQTIYHFLNSLVDRIIAGENIALECFCSPKPCHGHVIKRALESLIVRKQLT